jgi:hypothetical protein
LSTGTDSTTIQPSNNGHNPDKLKHYRSVMSKAAECPEGQHAFRETLMGSEFGIELVRKEFGVGIVHRGRDTRPLVAVLIPTHKKPENETGGALEKLIAYSKDYCHIIMRPLIASSVVHWVRNALLANLYASKIPFDYVLFMDDDMVPPPDALKILLERKQDVVGAVCTVRQDPPLPNARHFDEKTFSFQTADIDQPGIWNVGAIGTGFILLSKKVLDDVGEYTLSQRYWAKYRGMSEDERTRVEAEERKRCAIDNNKFWFEFLKHPGGNGEIGEDISFCLKAKECGYEIFADSTVNVGHIGGYAFSIQDYWYYREQAVKDGKVVPLGQQKELQEYKSETRISLLMPTRGRPDNIVRLLKSLHDTSHVMPQVICRIDDDDAEAKSALDQLIAAGEPLDYICGPRATMTSYWNECAKATDAEIVMFAADDLIFRTKGWDSAVIKAFDSHPDQLIFVHGNDGHWGNRFGTHGFLHRKWIDAVGYVLPPYFSSDYGDTWVNDVANALNRRVYVQITTEHMHPLWGKADMDATYQERLARHQKDGVEALYVSLLPKRAEDVEKLKALMVEELVTA